LFLCKYKGKWEGKVYPTMATKTPVQSILQCRKKKKKLKSNEKGGKPKECLAMHINSMNIYLACPQTPWNVELVQSPAFFMMWKASYS
jgi:hypothetical protein